MPWCQTEIAGNARKEEAGGQGRGAVGAKEVKYGEKCLFPTGKESGESCALPPKFLKISVPNGILDALWCIALMLCWQLLHVIYCHIIVLELQCTQTFCVEIFRVLRKEYLELNTD